MTYRSHQGLLFFVLSLICLVSFSGISVAQQFCSGEHGLKSTSYASQTQMTFNNSAQSEEDSFNIYWLNYQGKRVHYKTLYKGDSWTVNTYLTHPWVVTSPIPGGGEICINIYMPNSHPSFVNLN